MGRRYRLSQVFFITVCLVSLTACGENNPSTVIPAATFTHTIISSPTTTTLPTHTSGVTAKPVLKPTGTANAPAKAPFGSPFVVYTQWDGQEVRIYAAKLDEDPIKIYGSITQDNNMAYMPVWSPDGTKFAYLLYDRSTKQSYFKLHDILSSETSQLSDQAVNIIGLYCWTFDQKFLIWSGPQPDGAEKDIYRLELETGEIVDLTQQSKIWDAFPSCSPVGDQIAFVSDRKGTGKEEDNIWLMDSQGQELKQLTNTPFWENTFPSWSPDGLEIAFFRYNYSEDEKYGPAGLWAVNTDGSGERLIIELDKHIALSSWTPGWSPDGKYIAYSSGEDESKIYIIPASGGEALWSSDLPGENSEVSWSANSEYLIFTNNQEDGSRIYIVGIDGLVPNPMLPDPDNFLGRFSP